MGGLLWIVLTVHWKMKGLLNVLFRLKRNIQQSVKRHVKTVSGEYLNLLLNGKTLDFSLSERQIVIYRVDLRAYFYT